jgi:phosphoglycolate phosphatase-like HAD superfamily hydrolase
MVRHIMWDMGGTLFDTYADVDACLLNHVRSRGRGRGETIDGVARLTRVSTAHAISVLAARHHIPESELRTAVADLKKRWEHVPPPLMDGAVEVLDAVHRAGGLNLVITHRDRESAELLIRMHGLTQIDDMMCAPDGYARKPDPAMYNAMVERNRLDRAQCLSVGDRPIDIEASLAARISGALLDNPHRNPPKAYYPWCGLDALAKSTQPCVVSIARLRDLVPLFSAALR